MTNVDSILKKKKLRHHFDNKGSCSESYGFSSSPVRMWELDHKKGWVSKNWCFQIVVLEKTLESPLDSKEIKSVNPKGKWKWKWLSHVWLFVTPWTIQSMDSPDQNIGVGSHSLLQEIFPTQGLNPGLPQCRRILYQLSHKESPVFKKKKKKDQPNSKQSP